MKWKVTYSIEIEVEAKDVDQAESAARIEYSNMIHHNPKILLRSSDLGIRRVTNDTENHIFFKHHDDDKIRTI